MKLDENESAKFLKTSVLRNQGDLLFSIPYRGKKSRGKFSSEKNLVTSEKLVTFPRLIFQIRYFSPTNF